MFSRERNKNGPKFAARLGFKTIGQIPDYSGPREDRLVVELEIKGVKIGEV